MYNVLPCRIGWPAVIQIIGGGGGGGNVARRIISFASVVVDIVIAHVNRFLHLNLLTYFVLISGSERMIVL